MSYERDSLLQAREAQNFRGTPGRETTFAPTLPTIPIPFFESPDAYPFKFENHIIRGYTIVGDSLFYVGEDDRSDTADLFLREVSLTDRYKTKDIRKLDGIPFDFAGHPTCLVFHNGWFYFLQTRDRYADTATTSHGGFNYRYHWETGEIQEAGMGETAGQGSTDMTSCVGMIFDYDTNESWALSLGTTWRVLGTFGTTLNADAAGGFKFWMYEANDATYTRNLAFLYKMDGNLFQTRRLDLGAGFVPPGWQASVGFSDATWDRGMVWFPMSEIQPDDPSVLVGNPDQGPFDGVARMWCSPFGVVKNGVFRCPYIQLRVEGGVIVSADIYMALSEWRLGNVSPATLNSIDSNGHRTDDGLTDRIDCGGGTGAGPVYSGGWAYHRPSTGFRWGGGWNPYGGGSDNTSPVNTSIIYNVYDRNVFSGQFNHRLDTSDRFNADRNIGRLTRYGLLPDQWSQLSNFDEVDLRADDFSQVSFSVAQTNDGTGLYDPDGYPNIFAYSYPQLDPANLPVGLFPDEQNFGAEPQAPNEVEWVGSDTFSFFVPVVRASAPLYPEGEPRLVRAESSDGRQGVYSVVASGEIYVEEHQDGTIDIYTNESEAGNPFRVDSETGAVFVPYRLTFQLVSGEYTMIVRYTLPSGQTSFRRFIVLVQREGDVFDITRQFRGSSPLGWWGALSLALSLPIVGRATTAIAGKIVSTATRSARLAQNTAIWTGAARTHAITARKTLIASGVKKTDLAVRKVGEQIPSFVRQSRPPLIVESGLNEIQNNANRAAGTNATSLTLASAVPVDLTGDEPELVRFIMSQRLDELGLNVGGLQMVRWASPENQKEPNYNSLFELRQFRAGGPYDPIIGFELYWKSGARQMKQIGEEYWLILEAVSQTPDNVGVPNDEIVTTLIVGIAVIEATAQG